VGGYDQVQTIRNYVATLSSAHKPIVARANLYLLKRGPPAPPEKCSEIVVEPFDDGWPEYEEIVIDVQA